MCNFFSFVTDGGGKYFYFDWKQRQKIDIGKGKFKDLEKDSHTSIAHFHGYKGEGEDKLNKYEYDPLTKTFRIDQINIFNDADVAQKWVRSVDFALIDPIKLNLPLPAGLTSVGGHLFLGGYTHPLPEGLMDDERAAVH